MKAITTWNFGNFTVTAESEITPEDVVQKVLNYGLTQLLQRVPASNAEKELVGHTWPKNGKGTPERPKGFQRGSIPFSKENVDKLVAGFGTTVEMDGGYKLPFTITSVVENEGGGESAMIGAERFVENLLGLGRRAMLQTLLSFHDKRVKVLDEDWGGEESHYEEDGETLKPNPTEAPKALLVEVAHAAGLGQRKVKK